MSDGALGTSTPALIALSFPDRISLMTFYFPDEIDEIVQPELTLAFDLFGVSVIEIAKEILAAPAQESVDNAIVVGDLFDGPVGLVEGVSDFVDPPMSFDVLSGFVSRHDDVFYSSFIDLSIF